MKNYAEGIFHLSVNADGLVSLWDTREQARHSKDTHESTVELRLTPEQINRLDYATDLAFDRQWDATHEREHL
jgi:hypothetical protein